MGFDVYKFYLIYAVVGYLSGSVLYAYLIPRLLFGADIREGTDDANPGMANAFKYVLNRDVQGDEGDGATSLRSFTGLMCGVLVLICELLKGIAPIYLSLRILDPASLLFAPVLAAPVLGHIYPFLGRTIHGGKGIAVSFGVLLGLWGRGIWQPAVILAVFYVFFSIIIVIDPHRARTLAAFLCFLILTVITLHMVSISVGCALLTTAVMYKHARWREDTPEPMRIHSLMRR